MPSECSVSLAMLFRDPHVLPMDKIIFIASSGQSEGYVPCNYVLKDKSDGYYPLWDRED